MYETVNPTEKLERKRSISFSFRYEWTWILSCFSPEREFLVVQQVCNSILTVTEDVAEHIWAPVTGAVWPHRWGVGQWLWNARMLLSCATDMRPYRRDVPLSLFFACIWCLFFSVQKLKQGSAQVPKGSHIINTTLTQTAESDFEHEGLPELCNSSCIQTCRNLWWIADDCSFGRTGLASSLISKQLLMIFSVL